MHQQSARGDQGLPCSKTASILGDRAGRRRQESTGPRGVRRGVPEQHVEHGYYGSGSSQYRMQGPIVTLSLTLDAPVSALPRV